MKKVDFTFCSKCNRVIGPDLTDKAGRCPDCQGKQSGMFKVLEKDTKVFVHEGERIDISPKRRHRQD